MKKLDYNRMFEHWMESSLVEREGKRLIPPDITHCRSLMIVCRTMAMIAVSKDELFRKPDRVRKGRSGVVANGRLGRKLQECLDLDFVAIRQAFPQHRFNPHFDLFEKLFRASLLWRSEYARRSVDALNEFVDELRAAMKPESFGKKVKNHERGSVKNAQRVSRYISDLFGDYPKLLFARLDFSYLMPWPRDDVSPVTASEMKDHREKLMRYVRKKFKKNAVGNIWTVEFGDMKGPHFHIFFIFNGHKLRQGITIAQQIGEHWKSVITQGKGLYWNVNLREDALEAQGRRGIGLIAHSDEKRRANLIRSVEYLIKIDLFVRSIMPGLTKTFGHGKFVPRKRSNAGRKRKGCRIKKCLDEIVQGRGSIRRTAPPHAKCAPSPSSGAPSHTSGRSAAPPDGPA